MSTNWKNGPLATTIWTILRVWLGIEWLKAGWGKVTGEFDSGGFMKGAIAKATGEHPAVQGWYAAFLENFALPNAELFSFLVAWGEVLVGIGLILGAATIPALLAGAFMNLNFLLAGTTSTNPMLYTVAIILLFVGAGAYRFGLDRWIVPYLKNHIGKNEINSKRVA
ncbi:DoxX family protein [Peribacillus acanthi]|uniref:DoxX family protein n=1 Tax=Peribacillus acanthi TaxID=2171554 RepID=UPI000D3E24E2|nr:DoxX family protein [Peribacillus acanthi]